MPLLVASVACRRILQKTGIRTAESSVSKAMLGVGFVSPGHVRTVVECVSGQVSGRMSEQRATCEKRPKVCRVVSRMGTYRLRVLQGYDKGIFCLSCDVPTAGSFLKVPTIRSEVSWGVYTRI